MTHRNQKLVFISLTGVFMYIVTLITTIAVGINMNVVKATTTSLAGDMVGNFATVATEPKAAGPAPATPPPAVITVAQSAVITAPSAASLPLFVDPTAHTLASQPVGKWFGGWNTDIKADVATYVNNAAAAHAMPLLVLYNIPGRDCGSYSAGGAAHYGEYTTWVQNIAASIGDNPATIVLEPDAVAGLDCLDTQGQAARLDGLAKAVATLKTHSNTHVYLDGGNARWQTPATMAQRLNAAGLAAADGFALNVSNFIPTDETIVYGNKISALTNGAHFVVDTSRNGNGTASDNQWCNPRGRALGQKPTFATGIANVDAFLWVKVPGESDGTCNGGPSAGTWWQDYADELLRNSKL